MVWDIVEFVEMLFLDWNRGRVPVLQKYTDCLCYMHFSKTSAEN